MRKFLIGVALTLLAASSVMAQQKQIAQPDFPMDKVLAARASLIARYVQSQKFARGVAVCGEQDLLTGEDHTFLTIYVWRDAVPTFLKDYLTFASPITPGGDLGIDGIPVSVTLIGEVAKIQKEPNASPPAQPQRNGKV